MILAKQEAKDAGKKKKRHHKRRVESDEEVDNGALTKLYRYVMMIECDWIWFLCSILTNSDYVSKIYLHGWSRILVFLLFVALIAFSAYKVTTIQQGIVPEDAVAEDR